jgi:hypothetical protein
LCSSGIVLASAWAGTQAKQRGLERAAAACSVDERQELQSLGTVPTDGEYGTGMQDGSCRGVIAFLADEQAGARLDAVRQALTAPGWIAASAQQEERTIYRKAVKDLEMTVIRNKAVEVTLSLV